MNPTKDHIVHEGRVGVPDPAFPFPKLQPPDLHGEWKDDKYKKAFDAALLHTAWFADEEQNTARYRIWCSEYFVPKPKTPKERYEEYKPKDGLYTVPAMYSRSIHELRPRKCVLCGKEEILDEPITKIQDDPDFKKALSDGAEGKQPECDGSWSCECKVCKPARQKLKKLHDEIQGWKQIAKDLEKSQSSTVAEEKSGFIKQSLRSWLFTQIRFMTISEGISEEELVDRILRKFKESDPMPPADKQEQEELWREIWEIFFHHDDYDYIIKKDYFLTRRTKA